MIQVDELDAVGIHVLELCLLDTQLGLTLFFWNFMLALCHDLKVADYVQNYAGIIFASLPWIDILYKTQLACF